MNYKKKEHFRCIFQRFLWLLFFICSIVQVTNANVTWNNTKGGFTIVDSDNPIDIEGGYDSYNNYTHVVQPVVTSSVDSGTETELYASGGTRANEQVDGESFFISGMYIAGKGSTQAGNMTSKGFKLRTGQDNNRVVLSVNFPYTITDVAIEGIANYEAKEEGACISVTKVEVDGIDVPFSGGQFPPKGSYYSESLTLEGIHATETIAIYFDNSNASGTQINMSYSVSWERPNTSEPSIKVSPETLGLIVGESYEASVKIAPKTFSTYWYSDNNQVATVDENGKVYAKASGKAHIIHAWSDDVHVSDTIIVKVTNLGVLTPYIVKKYDFTSMGDITLTIADEQVGYFYMADYYTFTPVYACTNLGLEDLAIQQPLVDERSGWAIVGGSGLYMGSGSDKSAAICNLKAGQIVDIEYTGSKFFLGTYEGEAKKKNINESNGRAIFQMEEDGMIGFGLTRGSYVSSITIYQKKILSLDNLTFTLPERDILYDGESHGAMVSGGDEMGALHIYYDNSEGVRTEEAPSSPGTYMVSFEFEESDLYYATEFNNVGQFSIYSLDSEEYNMLISAYQELDDGREWNNKWDFSAGIIGAKNLYGVVFKEGHIIKIDLNENNLTGSFPFALLNLPYLEQLDVQKNNLTGDLGTAMENYQQVSPTTTSILKKLSIAHNQFTGNIGLFAKYLPKLNYLNAAYNKLTEVAPIISKKVTSLNIGYQKIDKVITLHPGDTSQEEVITLLPTILLYDHSGQKYRQIIEANVSNSDNSWSMTLSYENEHIMTDNSDNLNPYRGKSGDLLSAVSLWDHSIFPVKLTFDSGDGNFDGAIDILDLQSDINNIFEKRTNKPFNFTAANLWKDEQINVQDIICLVNLLMTPKTTETEKETNARRRTPTFSESGHAEVYIQEGRLMLNTVQPVAAFDIVVSGANSINIERAVEQAGITVSTKVQRDGLHIIGYALNGTCIPSGTATIGTLEAQASVRSAMLSDSEANAISVTFGGAITDIKGIEDQKMAIDGDIYDLQGRKVNEPYKGLYIQNGHKVVK